MPADDQEEARERDALLDTHENDLAEAQAHFEELEAEHFDQLDAEVEKVRGRFEVENPGADTEYLQVWATPADYPVFDNGDDDTAGDDL